MKPYEFMRVYHPKLGIFVHKHKGSGVIVDNIFKPMRGVISSVAKKFAKPLGKKAFKSGLSHVNEKMSKNTSEKSGDIIMKRLRDIKKEDSRQKAPASPFTQQKPKESTDMYINRLISGSGIKRRKSYLI